MTYDNTNRGALFKNDNRSSDNHPHAKGTLNVDGVEYWISAWTKTSKAGERFQSLSVTRKEEKREQGKPGVTDPSESFDDDIPF